jgi:two-component system LytT family response regulator
MKLNCIIVDDSEIQRKTVAKLVSESSYLNLIGDYSNALDAKNSINNNKIDLIFLDIEMPIISGFDLLDGLKSKPQIIVISSKADYALKAFDYAVTDFLHKPISKNRFLKAVLKATETHALLFDIIDEQGESIIIKSNLKKIKLFVNKIKWIEALGDYIRVVTDNENHLVLSSMKAFVNELPLGKFIRVHKSYIINLERIDRYNSKFVEIGTAKIPMGRNKKEILTTALEKL